MAILVLLLALTPGGEAVETVTAIYPDRAIVGVATTVVIIGTGFSSAAAAIGSDACTAVSVDSPTQMTATVVATGATGTRDVAVGGGLLAAGFAYVQTAPAPLQLTINASVLANLALCWTANTTGQAEGATGTVPWTLSGIAAAAVRHTDTAVAGADAVDFEVRNTGNDPQRFVVSAAAASVPASGAVAWNQAAASGTDAYVLAVSDGGNVAGPTWLALTVAHGLQGGALLAVGATAAFDLQFTAPLWDSAGVAQAIAVTVTATP